MKISLQWLSEYVPLPPTPPAGLAQKLVLAGFDVEGLVRPGEGLEGVVVGQIKQSAPVTKAVIFPFPSNAVKQLVVEFPWKVARSSPPTPPA